MKRKIFIGILLLSILLLGGFDNSKELNELSIVSAIGIDITPEGKYTVSALILDTSKKEKGQSDNAKENKIYEYTDDTIQSALRNTIKHSPKKLHISHMELLIISEDLAKQGIEDCLDFFIRDNESSKEFYMLVAREIQAKEVLKIKASDGQDVIKDIRGSLSETYKFLGKTTQNLLSDNIITTLEEGHELTLASIKVEKDGEDEQKKEKAIISDLAYFKDDKLQGYLEEQDNIGYNFMKNKLKYTILQTTYEDTTLAFEVINCKTKLTPKIEKDKLTMNTVIDCKAKVTEVKNQKHLSDEYEYEKVREEISKCIKNLVTTYVENCKQVYQSDILGYGRLFRKKQNKEYQKIASTFEEEYFDKIETNITVNTELRSEQGVTVKW